MVVDLPAGQWDIVLADPPWSYYGSQNKWGAASKFYTTLSDQDLLNLPMKNLMNKKSICFLWVTSPKLNLGIKCISNWGLHYRGVAFVWIKSKKDGTPVKAQGVRASITKPTSEFVLAASLTKTGRPLPINDESVPQVVLSPKQEHSVKPDLVQEYIERMYPNNSKIELFARRQRIGWTCWGDECDL